MRDKIKISIMVAAFTLIIIATFVLGFDLGILILEWRLSTIHYKDVGEKTIYADTVWLPRMRITRPVHFIGNGHTVLVMKKGPYIEYPSLGDSSPSSYIHRIIITDVGVGFTQYQMDSMTRADTTIVINGYSASCLIDTSRLGRTGR